MKHDTRQVQSSFSHDPAGSVSAAHPPFRRILAVMVVLAAAALWLLLRQGDVTLMRWRYDIMPDHPGRELEQFLAGLREFGQVLSVVITLCIVAAYDRRRRAIIIAILLAEACSLVAFNSAKYTIARHRPYHAVEHVAPLESLTTEQTWIGWRPGNKRFDTQSFPSGHSAAAFTLAGVLTFFYPRLRWMFWTLATGCAASRTLDAVHWPSDCLVGITIGLIASNCAVAIALSKFPIRRSN